MNERVRLYGGELHAGRRTDTHGFEVRARIPLDGIGPSPHAGRLAGQRRPLAGRARSRLALALA